MIPFVTIEDSLKPWAFKSLIQASFKAFIFSFTKIIDSSEYICEEGSFFFFFFFFFYFFFFFFFFKKISLNE